MDDPFYVNDMDEVRPPNETLEAQPMTLIQLQAHMNSSPVSPTENSDTSVTSDEADNSKCFECCGDPPHERLLNCSSCVSKCHLVCLEYVKYPGLINNGIWTCDKCMKGFGDVEEITVSPTRCFDDAIKELGSVLTLIRSTAECHIKKAQKSLGQAAIAQSRNIQRGRAGVEAENRELKRELSEVRDELKRDGRHAAEYEETLCAEISQLKKDL